MADQKSTNYTRLGDDGFTDSGSSQRLAKDDVAIECYGDLDELNSVLGVLLSHQTLSQPIRTCLTRLQSELLQLGCEICQPNMQAIQIMHIQQLEKDIDQWDATLPPLQDFILPGGNFLAANCHLARTICRRAERHFVKLSRQKNIHANILKYMNRLSDLLFVIARVIKIQHV